MEERLAKVEALGSKANWAETEEFLNSVVKILLDYLKEQADPESKVLDFHHPEELRKLFNFELSDEPAKLEDLLEDCAKALKYQLSCGLNTVSLAGEWLTAAANTNMFTYEIAPVFILMEKEVLRNMWEAVGWTEADGIFAPGGAVSNLYAVNAARHHLYPRSKPLGMVDTGRLCMFTSEDAHYSMMGAAAVCGIGTDRCFLIPTDARHRMIPEALEGKIAEARAEGLIPFFVSATAGSTVYGAFDPIHAIADIAAANNMWCHVDAAWGGGVLLSEKHRELMSGVERANSVTWNPHKILGTLLQCSAVLIRHEGLLFQCNQMSADYLFQQDKPYDVSYDTGDKAFQCGRHNDVFKFWLLWRARGTKGHGLYVDRLMELAEYFTARLKDTEGFEMVLDEPEYLNICFWYVPPSIRGLAEKEKKARLEKIAPKIKGKMMEAGTTMVGYQPDKGVPNFFRMIISNPAIDRPALDWLIDEIVRLGKDL